MWRSVEGGEGDVGRGVGRSKVWEDVREMWAVGEGIKGDVGRSMEGVGRCGGNAERGGGRCAGVRGSMVKGEGERD